MFLQRLFLLALLSAASPTFADNWTRFRGENGSGVNEIAKFPVQAGEADFAWKIDLPAIGHGSPVVWGDRLFVLCGDEKTGTRVPMGIDLTTGKPLWQHKVEAGKFKGHRFNSPASTTPAVDANAVYFTWATKGALSLAAYTHEGKELWMTDLGTVVGGHGFGASPMVFGDLVVLNNDQENENGFLVALDRNSGKIAWQTPRKSARISYSTPVIYAHPKTQEPLLVFTNWTHGFTAIDPKSGQVVAELSTFPQEVNERAISSPIVWRDLIIGTCGFANNPKQCVAVRLNGGGKFEEVWRIEKSVPHIPSVIVVHDLLYLWDDGGLVTCVKPATGESLWRERVDTEGQTFGSPVSDGASIFCVDSNGTLHAIAAAPEFKQLGHTKLGDICRSPPAIAAGRLIIRTQSKLFAIKGSAIK
ncbi:MAG: PQQ-binding-like beta-propeller repeat protein [Verrucomicrobiaceae bacterium]|nr:PQQ-binding-like beta-propeller repeat protein [Verrucomicrobiaceae bacterium]